MIVVVDLLLTVTLRVTGNFTETLSDRCMSELIGHSGDAPKKCSVSNECYTVMFGKGQREYELTHQLLFSVLAEEVNTSSHTSYSSAYSPRR